VPDSHAGLAPLGCRDCESGGLRWLDLGHDPMVTMTQRPDFAYIYTTRRYAVPAAAGVTLNAGHVSDLGRGGWLYSAHNTFICCCRTPSPSDPPRLRFVASTSSALPRLCPGVPCASSKREFVLKKLCPKSPWVYSPSFAYDATPAFAHSQRPRRPAPRPPLRRKLVRTTKQCVGK
jgi:hypothetical protein